MSKTSAARKSADVIHIDTARKGKADTKATKPTKTKEAAPAKATKTAAAPAKPEKAAKPAAKAATPVAKASKGTVKVAVRTATIVGKATDTKPPRAAKGHFLFAVGKSIAQQALTTTEITTLPGKLPAAAKELLANGGTVSKAVAKTVGLDFAALTAKVQESKRAHVIAKATSLSVTPHADKANIVLGEVVAQKTPATKTQAVAKAVKSPVPAKATAVKAEKVKAPVKAAKVEKVVAKPSKTPAKAEKSARKGK